MEKVIPLQIPDPPPVQNNTFPLKMSGLNTDSELASFARIAAGAMVFRLKMGRFRQGDDGGGRIKKARAGQSRNGAGCFFFLPRVAEVKCCGLQLTDQNQMYALVSPGVSRRASRAQPG